MHLGQDEMNLHDQIDLAHIQSSLLGTRFAGKLRHFDSVESTNSLLLEAANAGAVDGVVYFADTQTAGRGRGAHRWQSDPGDGLYLSALVRPALQLSEVLILSLATGLAAQYAVLEATGLEVDIRWPNDLMIAESSADDAVQKKCGGILVETSAEPGPTARLRHAIIGIGLNIHQAVFPPELEPIATSLYRADQARREDPEDLVPIFRGPILTAFLRFLDLELKELERRSSKGRARLLQRFTASSTWVHDKRVSVQEQGGYTGTTAGLDDRGFLLVKGDDGRLRTVLSGGVRAL